MSTPVITPRSVTVPIYQGDDLAQINELRKAVNDAVVESVAAPARVGDGASPKEIAEAAAKAHDTFVTEASERAVKVVLVQLGRTEWRELVQANPPRDDDEGDRELGFNQETLGDALVALSLTKPASSPKFDDAEQATAWLDPLSHGEFTRLFNAAYLLNVDVADPKADLSSRLARISEETSRSPARLGEASASSTSSPEPNDNSG